MTKKLRLIVLLLLIASCSYSQRVFVRSVATNQKSNPALIPNDLKALFSVLYLGNRSGNLLLDEIAGNDIIITSSDFSTSTIPYSSTATLSLSNNAALKVDDGFDGAWFDDSGTPRQVKISYLVDNDYSRTLVKYSNTTPYTIEWIGLLDDNVTPTSDQWNRLHNYFQLPIYWSGEFNDFGFEKGIVLTGRGYKGWEAEVNKSAYSLPSNAVKSSLNKVCIELNNGGYFSKFNRLWIFMLNDASLVNTTATVSLISPESNRFSFPVAPTYTVSGFKGNGTTQYGLTNFNPSLDGGSNYTQNSASRILWKYTEGSVSDYLDGHVVSANNIMINTNGSFVIFRINAASSPASGANVTGVGYRAIDRSSSTTFSVYSDLTQTNFTGVNSASLVNESLTVLRTIFGYGSSGISIYGTGQSFNSTDHSNIRSILLSHKTRLGL